MNKSLFHANSKNYWTRFGLSATLLLTFVFILASTFWKGSYIGNLREDCASLYSDRLMPATTLFLLNDHVHMKRLLLEEHLLEVHPSNGEVRASVDYRLGRHDAAIEHLIREIEHTYLVDDESRLLHELRQTLSEYDRLEQALLEKRQKGEKVEYGPEIRSAFSEVRRELVGLTEVQRSVGRKLSDDSVSSAASATSLMYFQLGVAFVLGLLASALAMSLRPPAQVSTRSPRPPKDVH